MSLHFDAVRESLEYRHKQGTLTAEIPFMQVAVFAACNGGGIGRMAAEQPADFYIDDRFGGLPFNRKIIEQAVNVLKIAAEIAGMDAHNMPKMPIFHNMGMF